MGKTQLAIAFATQYHQENSSELWLDASSEDALKDSFRVMAEAVFDVREPTGLTGDQSLKYISRWLSDKRNTRWLLIFDNYDEPASFSLRNYCPYTVHGSIIVTTRLPDQVDGHVIRLQPIQGAEEQLKILETRSGRGNTTSDLHARKLVGRLSGLPLALATAGAYLRRSTYSFERYLREYEENWIVDQHWSAKLPGYERTLYTTWEISYDRLKREDDSAAQLLGLLAYFSDRRLWYTLFKAGLSEDLPAWLSKIISNDSAFESTMRKLTDYCFLEVSMESWSMHMCVHDWAFASLNKMADETQFQYAVDCVGALIEIEREERRSLAGVSLSDLAAHALRLEHIGRHHDALLESAMSSRIGRVGMIADLLRAQSQLAAAERLLRRTLQMCEETLESNHELTLTTVNHLGKLYRAQGKLRKSEEMHLRALYGKEKALGLTHKSTLNTLNGLGILYYEQGKIKEAEEMYRRAIQGREEELGPKHVDTLRTVNNLGVLYERQGKMMEAEEMYQRS